MSPLRNRLAREIVIGQELPPLHCDVTATTIVFLP